MPHDEELADRLRDALADAGVHERAMFGARAFFVNGHLAVSASGRGGLMVRAGSDETQSLIEEPYAEPFLMRGREMKGWVHVSAEGVRSDADLDRWAAIGVAYARSLPPK